MTFDPRLVWLIQENQEDRRTVRGIKEVLDELNVRWIGLEIGFRVLTLPSIQSLQDGDRILCFGPSLRAWSLVRRTVRPGSRRAHRLQEF
jgi:hypothetical protein